MYRILCLSHMQEA